MMLYLGVKNGSICVLFFLLSLLVFSSSLVAGGTDTVLPAVSLKTG